MYAEFRLGYSLRSIQLEGKGKEEKKDNSTIDL
jgi:hypothetical protein